MTACTAVTSLWTPYLSVVGAVSGKATQSRRLTALVFLELISISFYLHKMPSHHLNGPENDIFICEHTKKAPPLFFVFR